MTRRPHWETPGGVSKSMYGGATRSAAAPPKAAGPGSAATGIGRPSAPRPVEGMQFDRGYSSTRGFRRFQEKGIQFLLFLAAASSIAITLGDDEVNQC